MTEHPTPTPEAAAEARRMNPDVPHATPHKALSPAARRALLEAADRRATVETAEAAPEHGGPKGPEPTRYGDWEKRGLAVDF